VQQDENDFLHLNQNLMSILRIITLLLLTAIPLVAQTLPPRPFGPTPKPQQLVWHKLEYYAFVHFNMNTFTGNEWGTGKEDPSMFNPANLDCDQWARVFKEAGMKGIIITAKHHDGFCLWPSKYTEHSVKSSVWKNGDGDVIRDLSEACRRHGLKLGIYVSPWDRHEPSYGDSPRYNEHFKNQLRELLTNYGEVFEVWFDGACGEGPNGKRQVYDWPGFVGVVRECQPNAVIFSDGGPDVRWVGNEDGFANPTNWSLLRRDEVYPGYPNYQELTSGHSDGTHWVPAECDVSIRPNWYYRSTDDDKVKSPRELLELYFKSAGRNGSLLLNVPPDRRGLIHERDIESLQGFRKLRDEAFARDLARGATVVASCVRGAAPRYQASHVVDGDEESYWATDDSVTTASLVISFEHDTAFNCLLLQEAIQLGQRVESFTIEIAKGDKWERVAAGTTIGYKRILTFPKVQSNRIRVTILRSRACPVISTVSVFNTPELS